MTHDIVEVIAESREVGKYSDPNRLSKEAIPFIGQPKHNKSTPNKVYIRLNPLTSNGALLEFKTDDVVYAENVKTVSQKDGSMFQIVKIWIRKGSIGIKLEPFSVHDFSDVFANEFE